MSVISSVPFSFTLLRVLRSQKSLYRCFTLHICHNLRINLDLIYILQSSFILFKFIPDPYYTLITIKTPPHLYRTIYTIIFQK